MIWMVKGWIRWLMGICNANESWLVDGYLLDQLEDPKLPTKYHGPN